MAASRTDYIAIKIDEENGSKAWWDALDKRCPSLADSLRRNRAAVVTHAVLIELATLPGFDDGPEYAPNPILDCGDEGEMVSAFNGGRYAVFETLD